MGRGEVVPEIRPKRSPVHLITLSERSSLFNQLGVGCCPAVKRLFLMCILIQSTNIWRILYLLWPGFSNAFDRQKIFLCSVQWILRTVHEHCFYSTVSTGSGRYQQVRWDRLMQAIRRRTQLSSIVCLAKGFICVWGEGGRTLEMSEWRKGVLVCRIFRFMWEDWGREC